MRFISEKHEKRFREACALIDTDNRDEVAACYLLTAKKGIWKEVKKCIGFSELDMDLCAFEPQTVTEQALFNAAYDIYHFSDAVILRDLADPETIPNEAFSLIFEAILFLRFGFEGAELERIEPEYA
ncbi:MAG: hypothetical protein IKH92_05200 [Clostridiales bacterium]|nr:hypothetical protein [Clostridiales bacterium]